LAPFNTSESINEDNITDEVDKADGKLKDLEVYSKKDNKLRFKPKTSIPNLIYEREHNRHIDNGIWKDDAQHEEIALIVGAKRAAEGLSRMQIKKSKCINLN
jgi:hypothetical protein